MTAFLLALFLMTPLSTGPTGTGGWTGQEAAWLAQTAERLPPQLLEDAALSLRGSGKRRILVLQAGGARTTIALPAAVGHADFSRTVAFLLLQRLEQREGWSKAPEWRSINGWGNSRLPGVRPTNVGERAYVDERGRMSPRDDLLHYLTYFLLPPSLFSESDHGVDGDDAYVRCSLRAQAMFVEERLRRVAPSFRPHLLETVPACSAFERWANLQNLTAIEIVLAAPSPRTLGSLFGHLFLRLQYDAEGKPVPLNQSRSLSFLARTPGPAEQDPLYPLKGLTGVYRAYLYQRSFLSFYREYVVDEGRTLRRWELHLSPEEEERLLAHAWTVRQTGAYRYLFMTQNCASLLLQLINGVLPPHRQVQYARMIADGPTPIIEGLTHTPSYKGDMLIQGLPTVTYSLRHDAILAEHLVKEAKPGEEALYNILMETYRASEKHRAETAARNEERLADLRKERDRLLASLAHRGLPVADLASRQQGRRLDGYRALLAAADATAPSVPANADDLRRLALFQAVLYQDASALESEGLSVPLFIMDPDIRLRRQPYVGNTWDLVSHTFARVETPELTSWLDVYDPVAVPLSVFKEQRRRDEEERYQRSRRPTGASRMAILHSLDWGPMRSLAGLNVDLTVFEERLGGQRRHGFPPHSSFTFLRMRSTWKISDTENRPALADRSLRVASYRSLRPRLAADAGWKRRLGWDVYGDLSGDPERNLRFRHDLGTNLLVNLWSTRDLNNHLLGTLGLVYTGAYGRAPEARGAWHGLRLSTGMELRMAPVGTEPFVLARALVQPAVWSSTAGVTTYLAEAEFHQLVSEDSGLQWPRPIASSLLVRMGYARTPLPFAPESASGTLRLQLGAVLE